MRRLDARSRVASRYDLNPLGINPLRDALDELIDCDRMRACKGAKFFIAAAR